MHGCSARPVAIDGFRDGLVAPAAGGFRYLEIECRDPNIVGISAGREIEGMEEAVARLDGILTHQVMWRVAIVAGGRGMMGRLDPGVVLRAHGMTVRAGCGVVEQIGVALGVNEGVRTNAEQSAGQETEGDGRKRALHRRDDSIRQPYRTVQIGVISLRAVPVEHHKGPGYLF